MHGTIKKLPISLKDKKDFQIKICRYRSYLWTSLGTTDIDYTTAFLSFLCARPEIGTESSPD